MSLNEYTSNKGGVWYYTQNKFGSEWVNRADNAKGWTVDFNLRVSDIQNSELIIDENDKGKGIGLYINDGTKQETINFLTQQIVFTNANHTKLYDATQEVNYRLTGKDNNLKLYARPYGDSKYRSIADVNFIKDATPNGNSLNPSVFEDTDGNLHVVWWDDGGNLGSIYYSKFDGTLWTDPEKIVSLDNGVQFPSVIVNVDGTVFVSFESKQAEGSIIGLVYRNDLGWSNPYYTGVDIGYSRHPKMTFDSQSNVCIVWEDHRKTHQEIYLNIFLSDELKWKGEIKLSTNPFGSYRPAISSYMDDIFVSLTQAYEDNTSHIEVLKYNVLNGSKLSAVIVSGINSRADHSSILCNVSGKVLVVWHDNPNGKYEIYSSILTPSLDILENNITVTDSHGGAKFPVLSEQLATGAVYIAWQDYKSGDYSSFDPTVDPSGVDPYDERQVQQIEPNNSAIYVAVYGEGYLSSGNGSFDVKIIFDDERNSYMPSIPSFFSGELPIVYESYFFDEYGFLNSNDMLRRVRCSYYSLSRSETEFLANNETITDPSDEIFNIHRDYILNKNIFTKEIRFGDFSDVIDAHYVFKEFKYYVNDAVEPYNIKEIGAGTVGIDSLSAADAVVNNYGDAWVVGICGTYFYFANQDRALKADDDFLGGALNGNTTRSIAFDSYNNMYIGGDFGVKYSLNHIKEFSNLVTTTSAVVSMVFDQDDILYVGTSSGLTSYTVSYDESVLESGDPNVSVSVGAGIPILSGNITSLKVDANNALWVGTYNGMYRLYKNKLLRFDISNGLPSNRINDIAIRNTAIRYIATSNGISKMIGFNFDSFMTSEDDTIWNNNVKSVMWKDPNILFAGTMSRLNQIIVNDVDETYSTVVYEPSFVLNSSPDDFQTYYLDDDAIDPSAIIEVYINGNKIHYGYDVGSDNKTIRFRVPLSNSDVVEVVERKDLNIVADFSQTISEKTNVGSNLLKIKDIAVKDLGATADIFVISEGIQNEVKLNDSDSILPFDRIHLDTHPPDFRDPTDDTQGIKIKEQIDRTIVKIDIVNATDDILDADGNVLSTGSGIDTMVISNNEEFLEDDGVTPKTPVPFSNSTTHNLGLSLAKVVKNLNITSGEGSVVTYVADAIHLYAGVSKPAVVYKYNWITEDWEVLFSYDSDQYIDFIEKYNNNLIISVGHDIDPALLYIYDYDSNYNLTESSLMPLFESRAYSSHILNGKFYIGTGLGGGDEYINGAGDSGSIYVFEDATNSVDNSPTLTKIVDGIDEDVYGLTSSTGSSNLLAATGPNSYIYEIDIENKIPYIVYNSDEAIVSLNHQEDLDGESINTTFAGVKTSGKIRRSVTSNNTYDISFRTTPGKVSALKIFPVITGIEGDTSYTTTFAAVGSVIYYLSRAGTWVWKYTHNENINDMAFDDRATSNSLYVISDNGVTKINPLSENKVVYLKLIDRAGNESILDYTLDGDNVVVSSNPWVDSVSISSLVDFVSENKIFELDELGNIPYSISDPNGNRYYSANKINEEKGEYVSEVFDGTNDLVKWEALSWQTTELYDTSVLMYVRTSTSANDILTADWLGPYVKGQSSGVTLSHMQGQFIQFKVELKSVKKDTSPTFHRATIRAITSESVHFFTTNFIVPTRIQKGLITSKKTVPVAADVVFGLNTTNSVDWTEYQQVDENRIFNINQTGHNLRVGIKFISPNRSTIDTTEFGEYGPYDSNLNVNTIPFDVLNNTGSSQNYHFKVTLYSDVYLRDEVFSAYSADSPDGFSVDGEAIPTEGANLLNGEEVEVLFVVSGAANIDCETYYFARIEYIYSTTFELVSENTSFVASCTSSFIDVIDFNFTNNDTTSNDYHFAIRFYQDTERTNLFTTALSANDRTGWLVDDVVIPMAGATVSPGETVNIVYRPDPDDFTSGSIFYLTIEAHDGDNYVFSDSSYTFQIRDVPSTEVCGEYGDVPIVENFGIMFELDNNEFITLNV